MLRDVIIVSREDLRIDCARARYDVSGGWNGGGWPVADLGGSPRIWRAGSFVVVENIVTRSDSDVSTLPFVFLIWVTRYNVYFYFYNATPYYYGGYHLPEIENIKFYLTDKNIAVPDCLFVRRFKQFVFEYLLIMACFSPAPTDWNMEAPQWLCILLLIHISFCTHVSQLFDKRFTSDLTNLFQFKTSEYWEYYSILKIAVCII